jgi:hypothetical protein
VFQIVRYVQALQQQIARHAMLVTLKNPLDAHCVQLVAPNAHPLLYVPKFNQDFIWLPLHLPLPLQHVLVLLLPPTYHIVANLVLMLQLVLAYVDIQINTKMLISAHIAQVGAASAQEVQLLIVQ